MRKQAQVGGLALRAAAPWCQCRRTAAAALPPLFLFLPSGRGGRGESPWPLILEPLREVRFRARSSLLGFGTGAVGDWPRSVPSGRRGDARQTTTSHPLVLLVFKVCPPDSTGESPGELLEVPVPELPTHRCGVAQAAVLSKALGDSGMQGSWVQTLSSRCASPSPSPFGLHKWPSPRPAPRP